SLVLGPDEALVGNERVREEHLVELRLVRDLAQWSYLDTGSAHVEDEVRDPAVLRRLGIGAGEAHAPVRELGVARPHLLTVQQPTTFGGLGARAHRREVAAGTGLAEELAPQLACLGDVGRPAPLRGGRAGSEQRRPAGVPADPPDEPGGARPRQLLGHDEVLARARAATAVLLGPGDAHPPPFGELRLPVAPERDFLAEIVEVGREALAVLPRQVLAQPPAHLGANLRRPFRLR